jgi:hypothetical protein
MICCDRTKRLRRRLSTANSIVVNKFSNIKLLDFEAQIGAITARQEMSRRSISEMD